MPEESMDTSLPPPKPTVKYTPEEDAKAKVLCDLGLFIPGAYLIVEYASRCIGESPDDHTIVLPTCGTPMDVAANSIRVYEYNNSMTRGFGAPDQYNQSGSIDMSAERLACIPYAVTNPNRIPCLFTGGVKTKRGCVGVGICHHIFPVGPGRLVQIGFDRAGNVDGVCDYRETAGTWDDTALTMSPNSEPANKRIYCDPGNDKVRDCQALDKVRDCQGLLFSYEPPPPAGTSETTADLEKQVAYIGMVSFTDTTWSVRWYPYANYVSEHESLYRPTHFYVCDDWLVLKYENETTRMTTLKRVSISTRFRDYYPH